MFKKFWPVILLFFIVILLIFGYVQKKSLNRFISEKMQEQSTLKDSVSVDAFVKANYNYKENGQSYEFTFLEFSSSGCAICKQMEPVLEEVSNSKVAKVNVVFLHIMNPDNQEFMRYYGVSAVPMQVLLDNQGIEFFRHYGFISAEEIFAKAGNLINQ